MFTEVVQHNTDGWNEWAVAGKEEGSWYPDVVTLHLTGKLTKKYEHTISFDLHEGIPMCTERGERVFGILLAPQTSCYSAHWNCVIFPLCISSISLFSLFFFESSIHCVCEELSSLVVWRHNIGASLHSEISAANDNPDLSKVGMCSCWHSEEQPINVNLTRVLTE